MRCVSLLLIASALASCSAEMDAPMADPQESARLQQLVAGRVAGQPMSCLPNHMANKMITVDSQTIAFRDAGRLYVSQLSEGCGSLGIGRTLVLRNAGGSLCRGQIAEVVDIATGVSSGGCVFGDFVPYSNVRG